MLVAGSLGEIGNGVEIAGDKTLGLGAKFKAVADAAREAMEEGNYRVQTIMAPQDRSDGTLERQTSELKERSAALEGAIGKERALVAITTEGADALNARMEALAITTEVRGVGAFQRVAETQQALVGMAGIEVLDGAMVAFVDTMSKVDEKIYRTFGDMSGDLRRVQEEIAAIQEEITRRDDKFAARIENAGDEYLQLAQRKADTAGWTTGELAGLEFQQKVLLQLEAEGIKLSAEKLELIEKQRAEMNRAMIEHERRETLALDVNAWLTRCLGGDDAKTFRLDAGAVTLSPLARLEALFEHRLNDTTDMQAEVDALTEKLSRTRRQLSKARTATKARVRQPRA